MKQTHRMVVSWIVALATIASVASLRAEPVAAKHGTADADGKTVWYDGRQLGLEGQGWADTESDYDRLPKQARATVPRAVWGHGLETAGLCVPFTTDAASIRVRWVLRKKSLDMPHMPATGVSGVDLYVKDESGQWRFVDNGRPTAISNMATFPTTPGGEYLLYLPLYNGVKSIEIGIGPGKTIASSVRRDRKPVVFYGTSITQGACASRPGMAFTAIVGRRLDVPVVNLGFSGSGKMEPALADLLAELDASVYVLDCLRNMTPAMVEERFEPFVRKLHAARPRTPILLAEDCDFRNVTPTVMGRMVRDVYEKLKREGMEQLYFVSNENMLGKDFEGTVDKTHPNDLGMMRQATAFVEALGPILARPARPADLVPGGHLR